LKKKKALLLKAVPVYTMKVHGRRRGIAPLIVNRSARSIFSVQH